LWRDDGLDGDYMNLFYTNTIMALTYTDYNVEQSLKYRYIYRARNINGWGLFSEPGRCFAADIPGKSQAPERVAFDRTSITVRMFAPEYTGGDEVTSYELYIDGGEPNTPFVKVQTYSDADGETANSLQHTLTDTDDSLTAAKIYSFKFRSMNAVGWSEFSDLLRVGLADQVLAP
jgi:hypothetical protein